MNGKALDHGPDEACGLDFAFTLEDFVGRPSLAAINVMQGGDDARGARLFDLVKRDRFFWTEPPPSLFQGLFLRSRCRRRIERQVFARETQVILKYANDKGMVLALRQTGDGDRAEAPCSLKENRETAAVGRIVL